MHLAKQRPRQGPDTQAGTDIFRLNCSHRRGGDFERVYPLIRKAAADLGKKALAVPPLS